MKPWYEGGSGQRKGPQWFRVQEGPGLHSGTPSAAKQSCGSHQKDQAREMMLLSHFSRVQLCATP